MSDFLIRGLPQQTHKVIQKIARSKNLSFNQVVIQLITQGVEKAQDRDALRRACHEAFEQVKKLRAEISKQYGKQEDSTKLIREDRETH